MPDHVAPPIFDLLSARKAVEVGDAVGLAQCLSVLIDAAHHPVADKVKIFLDGSPEIIGRSLDPVFGRVATAASASTNSTTPPFPVHAESVDQDYIAQLGGIHEWGVDQALTRLALERVPFRKGSAAVVGTMRDDGIYILEWVAHHRCLGFEHLFVYTNDNADHSDELLDALARAGIVTVTQNEVTGAVPPEAKAFGHALHLQPSLWRHEWALFVDSDEFLVPAPYHATGIANVIERIERDDPEGRVGAVLYDWLWYVSNMKFRREPGLLMERFEYTRDHWIGKCLVRLRATTSMRQQHCPDLIPGRLWWDSAHQPIDPAAVWERNRPQYSGGHVSHYWPKSFEEFAIKKARGRTLGGDENPYDRPYSKFFEWNGFARDDRHRPPPPALLAGVRREIDRLLELPGVAAAQARIEKGFGQRLRQICTTDELMSAYEHNQVPPGPL